MGTYFLKKVIFMATKTLNLKEVMENKGFIVKWGGAGADTNNKMNPGWMLETQENNLIAEIDEQTSLMKDALFIGMDSRQHALDQFYVRPDLQPMGTNGALMNGTLADNVTETIPIFARRELDARPFTAYTYTPKQFVWENVDKEAFLPEYEKLLAEAAGVSAESIGVYSKEDKTATTDKGYAQFDGLFKQLTDVSALTDDELIRENGKGYYGIIDKTPATGTIVEQLMDLITQFSAQKGKVDNAIIYTSTTFRGALLAEAAKRQTDLGDTVYLNGNDISVFGVPIKTADFLNDPRNGYGEEILICDPKAVVFGFVKEMESESTYEHGRKAYLSSVDVEFDAGMIQPKSVLFADVQDGAITGTVKNLNTSTATISGKGISAAVTVATNATVTLPVGTYDVAGVSGTTSITVKKGAETDIKA